MLRIPISVVIFREIPEALFLILSEGINVYILSFIFKDSINGGIILKNKLLISILCYLSLIVFFITIIFISKINRKKNLYI